MFKLKNGVFNTLKKGNKSEGEILRRKAIELLKLQPSKTSSHLSEAESLKLIHELEVHQIELELQNEELEQARSEAKDVSDKYIGLYDFAPSGYFTLSKEGNIVKLNLSGAYMLGRERSLLINRRFGLYVSNDTREVFNNFLERVFESKLKEYCEVTFAGTGDLSCNALLTGDITDDGDYCLVNMIDITGLRKTEQELVKAKEKAESADWLKSVFLANMSYELLAPLNSIIESNRILLKGNAGTVNDDQKKQLEISHSHGLHLLSLIINILDLSKMEAGQLELYYESFNIQNVIEEVLKIVGPSAKEKGLSLKFEVSPAIIEIVSDRHRVHQVLLNVLNNAVKFTGKGEVKVECYRGNGIVSIEISDTGIGIKKEHLDEIFKPFVLIGNELTWNKPGTGLGLSISKKLIELLQGSIEVQSEFGEGTTFTITLPV
jgi:signal transduction histidine kinase